MQVDVDHATAEPDAGAHINGLAPSCVVILQRMHHAAKLYPLHPEFVDPPTATAATDGSTSRLFHAYCLPSSRKQLPERPTRSTANGFDFCNLARLGIPLLTLCEVLAILPARLYTMVVKLSGAKVGSGKHEFLRGHIISFMQATASTQITALFNNITPANLLRLDVHKDVHACFLGPLGQLDTHLRAALPFDNLCHTRFPTIHRVLLALKACHPLYATVVIDDFPAAHVCYDSSSRQAPAESTDPANVANMAGDSVDGAGMAAEPRLPDNMNRPDSLRHFLRFFIAVKTAKAVDLVAIAGDLPIVLPRSDADNRPGALSHDIDNLTLLVEHTCLSLGDDTPPEPPADTDMLVETSAGAPRHG
jgi:hypothetical protein